MTEQEFKGLHKCNECGREDSADWLTILGDGDQWWTCDDCIAENPPVRSEDNPRRAVKQNL